MGADIRMVKRGDGEVETDERNIVKENTTKRSWMYIESAEWKRWGNEIEKQVILEGRAGSLHKEGQFVNFYLDIWSLKQGWKREVKAPEQGSPSTGPLTVFWRVRAVATVMHGGPRPRVSFSGCGQSLAHCLAHGTHSVHAFWMDEVRKKQKDPGLRMTSRSTT